MFGGISEDLGKVPAFRERAFCQWASWRNDFCDWASARLLWNLESVSRLAMMIVGQTWLKAAV